MIIEKENVACILQDPDGKILLIKRQSNDNSLPGFWELPSGRIDKGETKPIALVREVKEETGIDISNIIVKQVDEEYCEFETENGDTKKVTEHTFLYQLNNIPDIILSSEHSDFQWIELEKLDSVYKDENDLIYRRLHRVFA